MMKKTTLLILGAILLISLFFRAYQIVDRYGYGHDAELFDWIVKDMVVNHHPRLIGQLTSAPGIFIGPFFYYLLVPFFLLFKMDPVGALVPVTIIGILTTLSYYLVFSKLFSRTAGFITAFLHSILLTWIAFDRRIVPSTPTNLWVVWYFYTIIQIARGNFTLLPLLGILIGLIWDIHIALLPTLFAIPFAFFVSRKSPKLKEIFWFLAAFFATTLPLIIFEVKHNFIQTRSLIENFTSSHGGGTGITKLIYIFRVINTNINNLIFSPYSLPDIIKPVFVLAILSLSLFLIKKKVLTKKEVIPLTAMIIGVIGFFTLSSSLISEYYLYSIEIIFVGLLGLTFSVIGKKKIGKILVILILGGLFAKNLYHFVTDYIYKKDYVERKGVVEFITADAKAKGFPCIGISYITTPGENTGFRYFFYLKNQHLVHPSLEVPVYNIVIPDELSKDEVTQKFGHIGIIPPVKIPPKEIIQKSCQVPNTNLTDPMFGYVE
ncbi:glycosyltransferase family 39 protein [Patescibacteria group bacterium]|nr:glycosyltransferase family 39 protein [Patescibacteria group bacterium]